MPTVFATVTRTESNPMMTHGPSREHLNLRLIIVIPLIFVLLSLGVGLLAMALTQSILHATAPSSSSILFLRLGIVGSSLIAGLLGALLAYGITRPVRRAIVDALKMIRCVEANPPPIEAANELRALSSLFDQAYLSFIELVQAREILDGINEGIVAVDAQGKVAGMNRRAQETLEVSLAEARNKSLQELLGSWPGNRTLLRLIQAGIGDGEERVYNQVTYHSASGKEVPFSVRVSPLKLQSEEGGVLGAMITLTERQHNLHELPDIIGRSGPFAQVLDLIAKVAPTDSTILLTGESGTGKELIADAVHRLSPRKGKPIIKVNCAAIPEGLLESELFGHEKGAFTGAIRKKPGKFELADGGTLFMDEVGDMTPTAQTKLLRILQEKELMPVGGEQVKKVDVRIIAATHKELMAEVQAGRFREDLFYRLNVITVTIPPLRERKSDVLLLADHFLDEVAKRGHYPKKTLSRNALDLLLAYSWPGNIRELENAIERASLLSHGLIIQADDLPIDSRNTPSSANGEGVDQGWVTKGASLNEMLQAFEKELIIRAMKKSGGVQVEAAKLLGVNHKNLWHKVKKHNIVPNDL